VLQLPGSRHILVGLSGRTNAAALQQMQEMLPQHTLHGVPVAHGLHLKSACTALDSRTMVYSDDDAGRGLKSILQEHPAFSAGSSGNDSSDTGSSGSGGIGHHVQPWQHVVVDPACANLLLLGDRHVIMRGGFPRSEQLLEQMAAERGLQLHKLEYDEFAKADGSLTCCSILLP
jgi:dimethylargininase